MVDRIADAARRELEAALASSGGSLEQQFRPDTPGGWSPMALMSGVFEADNAAAADPYFEPNPDVLVRAMRMYRSFGVDVPLAGGESVPSPTTSEVLMVTAHAAVHAAALLGRSIDDAIAVGAARNDDAVTYEQDLRDFAEVPVVASWSEELDDDVADFVWLDRQCMAVLRLVAAHARRRRR